MKKTVKIKRVVNLEKPDFDYIKQYCNEHGLDMVRWMVLVIKAEINKNNQKLEH